jgi:ATP-dependent Clp protease ATP-binding subunit ClpA
VLLLDEIEKAHPDLFNILLQVMDHGKLTDNNGKQVDFRNVVLIMTTNAGAADMAKNAIGFGRDMKREGDDDRGDQQAVHAGIPQPSRFRSISVRRSAEPTVSPAWSTSSSCSSRLQLADRNVTSSSIGRSPRLAGPKNGYDELYGRASAWPAG